MRRLHSILSFLSSCKKEQFGDKRSAFKHSGVLIASLSWTSLLWLMKPPRQIFAHHVKAAKMLLEKSKPHKPACQIMSSLVVSFDRVIYYTAVPVAQSPLMRLKILWELRVDNAEKCSHLLLILNIICFHRLILSLPTSGLHSPLYPSNNVANFTSFLVCFHRIKSNLAQSSMQ